MTAPHLRGCAALLVALLTGCSMQDSSAIGPAPDGAHAEVALLETTDIHSNILSYDYYRQKDDTTLGFERAVTLIRRARAQNANSFLFDDGDTIQGSVMADYQALAKPVTCGEELGIYRALDAVGYDGGNIGNHEFNYGLPFLAQVTGTPMSVQGNGQERCAGPHFPLVLANVVSTTDGRPIFKPWTIVSKTIEVTAPDGTVAHVPLRIGIIGFTPPPIMQWDKQRLHGKVKVSGVVEAAQKYLPELQAQHPDLIVALVHGGIDTAPYTPEMENAAWHLAGLPGIDVMLLGHMHTEFPGPHFAGMQDVDASRGYVRDVPAVMGGFFGKDLGIVHLVMNRQDGRWVIDKKQTHSEVQPICAKPVARGAKPECVSADPQIAPLLAPVQQAAIAYVNTPIGKSDIRLSSYFADEGNLTAIGVVNAAQLDYVRNELPKLHPELASIPVISAASAFRTGFAGPDDYTDVAPGALTLRDAADLYFFPNTLTAVKINGAGLKSWLETSAHRFNRIDPAATGEQPLINNHYEGYNDDQMQAEGLKYEIDLSKPEGQRIGKLSWKGKPVSPKQTFIVATNNYRANGGGHFPGLDGKSIVLAAPDSTREMLAGWIKAKPPITAAALPPRAWHFTTMKTRGAVVFSGASGKLEVAGNTGLTNIRQIRDNGDGTALYAVDLGKAAP